MSAEDVRLGLKRTDRGGQSAVWIGEIVLALALAFAATYLFHSNGERIREGILLGTLAVACIAAAGRVRRSPYSLRSIWPIVAVACVLWIGSEGGRLLAQFEHRNIETRWLVSGVWALAAYSILLIVALRALAGSSGTGWTLALLDTTIVAVALCAPWFEFEVIPRLDNAGGAMLVPQLLAPVLAGVVLVFALLGVYTARARAGWSLAVVAALSAGLAGDLLASRFILSGGSMRAAESAWEGRALLVLVATACIVSTEWTSERKRLLGVGFVRLTAVIVAFAGALAFAAFAFDRGKQLLGFVIASLISALLMLRLLVHTVERHNHSRRLEQALREQEQLAVMDSLTGLYNRRFLDAELQLELGRGARSQEPVGILLCDLDHFKQINDRYGHLVGDSVLCEVARRLIGAVRNGDVVARYGGEEFMVLLPGGDKELLKELGERCRRAFEDAPFRLPGGYEAQVTISIGGACWPEDASNARELFEAADSALYVAKERGRNRIHLTESTGSGALGGREFGIAIRPTSFPFTASDGDAFAEEEVEQAEFARGGYVSAREEYVSTQEEYGFEVEDYDPAQEPIPVSRIECHDQIDKMERWAELVARALGLDEEAQRRCALAARYHDVGKSALPESILVKPGPLSEVEWELVQEHPERGASLMEASPELGSVAPIIREHHERFDGRGYPCGKSREEISPEARIVACCDAWDAMRNARPYAPVKTVSEARAELLAGRGTQFDPNVVMAFLMFDEAELDAGSVLAPI